MTAHSAVLQAAGLDAAKVDGLAEGALDAALVSEDAAIMEPLVKKSVLAPARLAPADAAPLVARYGLAGAIELLVILGSFHFINRIADLVDIRTDVPFIQRRWAWLRRLGVRFQALGFRWLIDLSDRQEALDADAVLRELEAARGTPLPAGYTAFRAAPAAAKSLECTTRPAAAVDPAMLAQVTATVAAALPASEEEATGFHARPSDPLDALAFVGTRYVVRTTDEMVDAVRRHRGWGEPELTDCFYAIAYRNTVERLDRLLATPLAAYDEG